MKLTRRSVVRLLVASMYGIPIAAFAAAPPHIGPASAHAASVQDETVIVVYDATNESKCTTWAGDPSNVRPCPAGSVVWTYPLARSAADKAHLTYVVPSTDPVATTRAVATVARNVHRAAMANASVTPSVAPSYAATDAARKIGVSPNVSNATGGQYTGRQGFAISYWVGWNNSGGSVVNIVSSTKAYGCCTNWKEDDLYANGTGTVFDRGCMALPNGSWTSQQGLPGTYPSGVEYYNETSDCGLFPANAYGYTYLNN